MSQAQKARTLSYVDPNYKLDRIVKSAEAILTAHQRHLYKRYQLQGMTKIQAIRKIVNQDME